MGQYTNLNGEQVKKRVEELIAQYAEHGIRLHLDADYIYADRQNEVWYGGEIASFEYQDRYSVYIEAIGDVEMGLYDENGDYITRVKDRGNNGLFYDEMRSYIPDDETLERYYGLGGEKARLIVVDSNWLEIQIYDHEEEIWLDLDIILDCDGVLDIGYEKVVGLVEEAIEENETD